MTFNPRYTADGTNPPLGKNSTREPPARLSYFIRFLDKERLKCKTDVERDVVASMRHRATILLKMEREKNEEK
jgi:hypothetical protein